MYRLVLALMISLMLTSCAFTTWVTRGSLPTLSIPSEYLVKCPDKLPDVTSGDKESVQQNRKDHQRLYHKCREKDDALIDELTKQGVKGT